MLIVSLIITLLISFKALIYLLNDYQKQYYDISRFIKLQKQKFKIHKLKIILFIISLIILFLPTNFKVIKFILLILSSFYLFYNKITDRIIRFKITNRIKRFIIEYCFIYLLFITLSYLLNISFVIIPIIYYLLFIYFFLLTCFINIIIEKIIMYFYKKKARKKLKRNKNLKIIGLTGSYGKTSTKNYTYHLLNGSYNVLMTPESYNTFNGILLTINNNLEIFHEILLLELGIDKRNGMNKFISFFDFDIASVIAIGSQHLQTFHDIKYIEQEKIKILTNLDSNKIAILNLDDPRIIKYQDKIKATIITISSVNKADIYATDISLNLSGISFVLHIFSNVYKVKTKVLGKNHINDILIAIAIAKANNIDDKTIINRLNSLRNFSHRLEYKKEGLWEIIDDSYNSNFKGFLDALEILRLANNKKVLITPGLIELDNKNIEFNKQLALDIIKSVDLVCLVTNNSLAIYNELKNLKFDDDRMLCFASYNQAVSYLKDNYLNDNLTILIENDLPDTYLK